MSSPSALRVERLAVQGFRNLRNQVLELGPHFNVVFGDNGAGKSNLLEAMYYLGALKSFRAAKTDDMVALGSEQAALDARVVGDLAPRSYRVELSRGRARRLVLDRKRPRSIAVWHAALPMVVFHPGHLSLAMGPPEPRRTYLDRVLEQMDPSYSGTLQSYQKALRSRNRLLKAPQPDGAAIRAFDEVLASAGSIVALARIRVVAELGPLAEAAFGRVTAEALPLIVEYAAKVAPEPGALREALRARLEKDLLRGYTSVGPHADDLRLDVRDRAPAKHHASQGQHRMIVLALKIAELQLLSHRTQRVPILLLDDVSSELDRTRNRKLFDEIAALGGQVLLTTTHPEFILLQELRKDFEVVAGEVSPVTS